MPDPKLKTAMAEIKAILEKHDIAGLVMLSSPSHMEYLRHYKTSWTCCWLEEGGLLRVRVKRADFPTEQAFKDAMRLTVGTLAGFMDAAEKDVEALRHILLAIGQSGTKFQHMSREEPQQ